MEMKQPSQRKHQIFFPHGFIDPLTGEKHTRFFVDDKHFDLIKHGAEEQGKGIRSYILGLLKEGKAPFSDEASDFAQTSGKKETVKVSLGIPYLIRFAQQVDFRQTWDNLSLAEWVEFFAWQDPGIKQALAESFKGGQTAILHNNPAFQSDLHRHFSEFIENLSYHFFVKNQTEIDLYFTLKDGTVQLSKIEIEGSTVF